MRELPKTIAELRQMLPEYAKDIKLNLGSVLMREGAPDLSEEQISGVALAAAYSTRNLAVISAFSGEFATSLSPAMQEAAKASATITAMNNIYFRFMHALDDADLNEMPQNLRMNVFSNLEISKEDLRLLGLAVSTINGCESCMRGHAYNAWDSGTSKLGTQSIVRIASVIFAAAQALQIESI